MTVMREKIVATALTASVIVGGLALSTAVVQARGMFDPSSWFGGSDDDRYYDRYRYGPYGYGGPYGGYGPYGHGGHYGYGGPYGWGPGYGQPSTIVVNPSGGSSSEQPPRLPE